MSNDDVWDTVESVRSMTIRDQQTLMSELFIHWNSNSKLHSHAHKLLKPIDGKRNPRRDFKSIGEDIESHMKRDGVITWKTANNMFSLGKAEAFTRVMKYVPDAIRSRKLHKEGGRNWYFLENENPDKWIASHDEGPIDFTANPKETAEALREIILKRHIDAPKVNVHLILTKEKTVFRLPNKFNSLYREWADRYLTPIMESVGYYANQTRKVYRKN